MFIDVTLLEQRELISQKRNKMQLQTQPRTRRFEHFQQIADRKRGELETLNQKIAEYSDQIRRFPKGDAIPELKQLVARMENRRKELTREISRALFNAGR
jgi:hypothetical protein